MSYTLITANRNYSSWSLRPWLLMKALGIPFEERLEPFAATSNYEAFRAFSPVGQVPVLLDDAKDEQRTIYDSLAITLYLADRHDGIWSSGEAARAWSQTAVAEMHAGFSALRNDCPMNVGVRAKLKAMSAGLTKDVARLGELWGEGLSHFGGPWLAGEAFTAADAFFAPVAYRVRTYDLDVGAAGRAWVDHIIAHASMQDWEAQALAESWREIGHEEELAACGEVIEDFRTG
ncbi:MAG: glutathione S-transferase [Sphingorhabdus sp.]